MATSDDMQRLKVKTLSAGLGSTPESHCMQLAMTNNQSKSMSSNKTKLLHSVA